MSLDVLANHIASQGRGRDSALIHMSPNEIESLRALAQAHGGDLTINPETGLPEAGFLEDILPAVAGFALDSFVPGLGELTGLGAFAAPAIVGGLTTLTNGGDWQKGLMAGLGAYGGANLSQGLGEAGAQAAGKAAYDTALASGAEGEALGSAYAAAVDAARANPSLAAGFEAAIGNPKDFLQENKWGLAALAAPALMSGMGKEQDSGAPPLDPGNIRPYDYDPRTQRYTALPTYKAHYAWGGDVVADALQGVESSANLKSAIAPKTGGEDSKAVYEYLMGRGPNPYLSRPAYTSDAEKKPEETPATDATKTAAVNPASLPNMTSGDGGRDFKIDPRTAAFFDNETPEQREARMAGVNNFLEGAMSLFSPVGTMAGKAFNALAVSDTPIGYSIGKAANFFSTPKTAEQIALTPVEDRVATFYDPTGDTKPTGYGPNDMGPPASAAPTGIAGTTAAMSGGFGSGSSFGAGYDPSASGTAAENDARSAGGDYGWATGGLTALAAGGIGHLGGYSDGGRLLKGPGDGVSDDIPATIGHGKEPARLADGEFVVPARIVSELGNGSTEAGARKLYQMMDRIQANRRKTVGKNRIAVNSKAERHLPA